MPKREEMHHSILIVSSSETFTAVIKSMLVGFITIDVKKTAVAARRSLLERDYELVVISLPLPDENNGELAIFASENKGTAVLLVTPQEVYDDALDLVTDHGIMVMSKAFPKERLEKAIRYLLSWQKKIAEIEKKLRKTEEKMEELRIVGKAKVVLVEKRGMTEEEAHRLIGKIAMDNGVSRRRAAERVLDEIG